MKSITYDYMQKCMNQNKPFNKKLRKQIYSKLYKIVFKYRNNSSTVFLCNEIKNIIYDHSDIYYFNTSNLETLLPEFTRTNLINNFKDDPIISKAINYNFNDAVWFNINIINAINNLNNYKLPFIKWMIDQVK